jgi:phenylacetate-CoA ligase
MFFSLASALVKVYTIPRLPKSWQEGMTEKRVIKTVRDAYCNVPFYRRKYDAAGIDIDSIRRLSDMKRLPVLTKDEIREAYPEDIVRRGTDLDKCNVSSTSGSTGKPMRFAISPSGYAYYLAESARIYAMTGYRPWQRSCYMRLAPMDLPRISALRQKHIFSLLPVAGQIEGLKKARPDLIDVYATVMLDIARHVTEEDLKYIKPRVITVNSEVSTQAERDYISRVFNCPVYDEYGSEETWSIATQCRRHNYHISSDSVWLEFLDAQGKDVCPGEPGEILITTTRSEAMPFIRYAIGDRGTPRAGECGCGFHSPLMRSVDGRSNDWLVLPSGRLFDPYLVVTACNKILLKHPLLFCEFKFVQQKPDLLVLRYVKGRDFDVWHLETILEDVKTLIGEPIIVQAEEGPFERGNKHQAIESLVGRNNKL